MRVSLPRLAVTARAGDLQQWLKAGSWKRDDPLRTHVLSQELCRESLKILKPNLPKPGTCDIIDINPGICVWSQAVHDVLKPRRHILVEPGRDEYARFLDPLLTHHESAYRYAPDIDVALDDQNGFLTNEAMNAGSRTKEGFCRGGEQILENKSLLVIANLTRTVGDKSGYKGTEARKFLHKFYRALTAPNQSVHRYGLVRLLAWVDESSKRTFVPISVVARSKNAAQLDAAFEVCEVASRSNYRDVKRGRGRWYELNVENLKDVLQAQKAAGIEIPSHRQPEGPIIPYQQHEPDTEFLAKHGHNYPHDQQFINELLAVETRLATQAPEWLSAYYRIRQGNVSRHRAAKTLPNKSADHLLYRFLMNRLHTYHNNFNKVAGIITQYRRLWHLITAAYRSGSDTTEIQSLQDQYDALELDKANLKNDNRVLIDKVVDDYKAYDSTEKTLAWNRRYFEPLLSTPEDFFPARPLALIDFTPRPSFLAQLDTMEKVVCFDYIASLAAHNHLDSVIASVRRLIHVGENEFLGRIPELKDVNRGGWHNLESLRIRTLNRDQLIRIGQVYESWPYRPEISKLIQPGRSLFQKRI